MTVIVLTNPTQYLRGTLAQYLLEIRANVLLAISMPSSATHSGCRSLPSAGKRTNS